MKIRSKLVLAGWILGAFALATPAFADSHGAHSPASAQEAGKGGKPEPSAEDRAKMADAHQKMAECLRSTRPMKECRGEMKKAHHGFGHGKTCKHGEACPQDKDCPHCDACDACDGGCKHHGTHGDGHGAMCEKDKGAPTVDAEKSKPATPKTKSKTD